MWIGIGIGVLFCIVLRWAFPLADYLQVVEEEGTPEKNNEKTTMVAEWFFNKPERQNTWMFVSFLALWSRVGTEIKSSFSKEIPCCVIGFFVYLLPFWSKGANLLGVLYGISSIALLFLAIVDWKTRYIPLEMSGIILICGLIHLFNDVSNWLEYLIGLIAVSGFLYIVGRIATPALRRKYDDSVDGGMGDGDIKLMAATGLLIGWKLNFIALGIGCIIGSIIHIILMKIKGSDSQLAFGPYLSLGVYITMICGEQLVSWYLNIMGYYSH